MNIIATCCSCQAHWWYREDWTPEMVRADRCCFCGGIMQIEQGDETDETARRLVLSALTED